MKNIKKKVSLIACTLLIGATLTGCDWFASFENDKTLKGGYLTTSKADYVVLNYGGNEIVDCYILNDVYVESESTSDGLRFSDKNGNGVIIAGDAKITRINNKPDVSKYVEYHKETDLIPYIDFYKKAKGIN